MKSDFPELLTRALRGLGAISQRLTGTIAQLPALAEASGNILGSVARTAGVTPAFVLAATASMGALYAAPASAQTLGASLRPVIAGPQLCQTASPNNH
jgi:hypothetical protein